MKIPGEKRSQHPDQCGNLAGVFAEAVRDHHMDLAWSLLSKETRGMRTGVWATRNDIDMQEAYRRQPRAAHDKGHARRTSMLEDFRTTVLRLWPLEDLTDLGVAPTDVHGRRSRLRLPALRRDPRRKHGLPPAVDVRVDNPHVAGRRRVACRPAQLAVPSGRLVLQRRLV